jgi:hypothetical protein
MGLDGTGGLLGSPANGPLRPIGNPSPPIGPNSLDDWCANGSMRIK